MPDEPLIVYVDEMYRILVGAKPTKELSARQRMTAVMAAWDGRMVDNPQKEKYARLALCQIGIHWHMTEHYPYDFALIAERLRSITPALAAQEVTGRVMLKILRDYGVPDSRHVRHL